MADMGEQSTQDLTSDILRPPVLSDETAQDLRAAAIMLSNLHVTGHSLKGIAMVDELQDAGLLQPGQDFDDIRHRALGTVSRIAAFQESITDEDVATAAAIKGDTTPLEIQT